MESSEELEEYHPGGYHPVHIGDEFKAGRYHVLHKLGWSAWSTVWLARDRHLARNVTLKVVQSRVYEKALLEKRALDAVQSSGQATTLQPYVRQLYDFFDHHGPNGKHPCLVLEVMGSEVCKARYKLEARMFSKEVSKAICRQAAEGLARLHAISIAHGDIHTSNMCFTAPGIDNMTLPELWRRVELPEKLEVYLEDEDSGLTLEGLPRYVVWPLAKLEAAFDEDWTEADQVQVKYIDFGAAFFHHETPYGPRRLRVE
ncbi:kinase-like domain-containing protein [Elsinoe ampelina]|uniref:non-specific serine/threonine protein kinase n=1 Tax=Elsinoe ampelina TaxID=302913 RepID=A0A6A6FZ75_9PEZI|nr:kinase-like domain-containing protein [Elsinoe ampelina]